MKLQSAYLICKNPECPRYGTPASIMGVVFTKPEKDEPAILCYSVVYYQDNHQDYLPVAQEKHYEIITAEEMDQLEKWLTKPVEPKPFLLKLHTVELMLGKWDILYNVSNIV